MSAALLKQCQETGSFADESKQTNISLASSPGLNISVLIMAVSNFQNLGFQEFRV